MFRLTDLYRKLFRRAVIRRPSTICLRFDFLEDRVVPTSVAFAVGAAPGGEPRVWVFDSAGNQIDTFLAYESTFTGGVRVAVADLNGDGTPDIITAPGAGGGPRVRAFDGTTGASLLDFMAYEETFLGGVWLAAGSVGNGQVGIATGADAGGAPRVRVFDADGVGLQDFFAFDAAFDGGVRVALGWDGTGANVYAAGGDGMAPTVRGFDVATATQLFEQSAGGQSETGGVVVTAGDLNADGIDEVVTAAASGTDTELRVFDGANGLWANDAVLTGTAYGLGILDWGGQPAVGLLDSSGLSAYALGDYGAAPTLLGSVPGSGWGGSGSSLGGLDPGPPSVPTTLLFTHTDFWGPIGPYSDANEQGQVTVEVSDGGSQYPGRLHWKYTFTSLQFNQYPPGYSYFSLMLGDITDMADIASSTGWVGSLGTWSYDQGNTGMEYIPLNTPVTFEFTTEPRQIIPIVGSTNDQLGLFGVGGSTFGPDDQLQIVLTDFAESEVGANGLKVAKWQTAFKLKSDGMGVELIGPDALNHDFIDRDPDRFNVWVRDKQSWNAGTPHIQAKISTKNVAGFTTYDDDATPVDLVRYTGNGKNETGWYWSDSQMLVSNEKDDVYSVAGYLGADDTSPGGDSTFPKNGYTWKISDRTHRVALRGTLTAEYTDGDGVSVSTKATVPVKKNVKVHVTVLRLTAGGNRVIEEPAANLAVHKGNEQYAQVGVLLIPQIQTVDPPSGVDLSNGLDAFPVQRDANGKIQVTNEEAALLVPSLRTAANDDVELYFVNFLSDGAWGEAFEASGVPDARFEESVIISKDKYGPFTIPHEIGHLLRDSGVHYTGTARNANLMYAPTSATDAETATKRLIPSQQTDMIGDPTTNPPTAAKRPNLLTNP